MARSEQSAREQVRQAAAAKRLAAEVEKRAIEMIEQGKPVTEFMKFGDSIRIEMFDAEGRSIFGSIDQDIEALKKD